MIISRTPLRISFFGGGTDYREYYLRYAGSVLGATINKYVYVSLNRLSNFFDYKIRVGYSQSELVRSVSDIAHPSVRECLKYKHIDGNLDIHIFADLPARTGLGSSSAFTVGFLNALHALNGRMVSKMTLATEAQHVEQDMIRENVGSQDQIHAAFGGINVIDFDRSGIRVQPLVISTENRLLFESSLMVLYTGQTRLATEILSEQVAKTRDRKNDEYLKRMHQLVSEAVSVFSDMSGDDMLRSIGALMNEGWVLKKSLSTSVSTPLIDSIYARALAAGAYGGKVSGAGGGGFVTLVVAPSKKADVRQALNDCLEVDLRFEDQGSAIIYMQP
ncbi:MAG: GHMP family kinase ATP-binding protein [Sulfobacillus sp.]